MKFLWPASFYLLGLIPVLILVYVWILRRRKPFAVRYSSLSLVRDALPKQTQWRRHIPFALFLLALASLIYALARPTQLISVPASNATIMLAIDVSRSMCSTDVLPSRIDAAKEAASKFVKQQKPNTRIGVVAFAGFAVVVQAPTTDHDALLTAINSLTTARRTGIGEGILTSLDALSQIDENIPSPFSGVTPEPLSEGQYAPEIIVLLTDGSNNTGTTPVDAAQLSAANGVRVFTIGFGTNHNDTIPNCGFPMPEFDGNPQFGGGGADQWFMGGGGNGFRREIDEDTLKQVADITGGTYHLASSANELENVFKNLPTQLIMVTETTEISVLFAAIGAVLVTLAIALSMIWHPLS